MTRALLLVPILAASLGMSSEARADFASCVRGIRSEAIAHGIPAAAFDQATAGVQPDMKILDLQKNQPEFKTPIWDYMAGLVDDERPSIKRKRKSVVALGKASGSSWWFALSVSIEGLSLPFLVARRCIRQNTVPLRTAGQ